VEPPKMDKPIDQVKYLKLTYNTYFDELSLEAEVARKALTQAQGTDADFMRATLDDLSESDLKAFTYVEQAYKQVLEIITDIKDHDKRQEALKPIIAKFSLLLKDVNVNLIKFYACSVKNVCKEPEH